MYIHERDNWTEFKWDTSVLTVILEEVSRKLGLLYGRLSSPWKEGERTVMENCQMLCRECNRRKADK